MQLKQASEKPPSASKCCRLQWDDEQNKTGQWLSDLSINNLYPEEEDMGL